MSDARPEARAKLLQAEDRATLDAFGLTPPITDAELAQLRTTLARIRARIIARQGGSYPGVFQRPQ